MPQPQRKGRPVFPYIPVRRPKTQRVGDRLAPGLPKPEEYPQPEQEVTEGDGPTPAPGRSRGHRS